MPIYVQIVEETHVYKSSKNLGWLSDWKEVQGKSDATKEKIKKNARYIDRLKGK